LPNDQALCTFQRLQDIFTTGRLADTGIVCAVGQDKGAATAPDGGSRSVTEKDFAKCNDQAQ